jgi:hypothetical protein
MPEETFWRRYFALVAKARTDVAAEDAAERAAAAAAAEAVEAGAVGPAGICCFTRYAWFPKFSPFCSDYAP